MRCFLLGFAFFAPVCTKPHPKPKPSRPILRLGFCSSPSAPVANWTSPHCFRDWLTSALLGVGRFYKRKVLVCLGYALCRRFGPRNSQGIPDENPENGSSGAIHKNFGICLHRKEAIPSRGTGLSPSLGTSTQGCGQACSGMSTPSMIWGKSAHASISAVEL